MRSANLPVLVLLALSLNACKQSEVELKSRAQAFRETADQCLEDVRDGGKKYETSSNCQSLERRAQSYIERGGFKAGEPAEIALIAEQGRATAWNARAISAANNPTLSLW